jgi:hypothetical protein
MARKLLRIRGFAIPAQLIDDQTAEVVVLPEVTEAVSAA